MSLRKHYYRALSFFNKAGLGRLLFFKPRCAILAYHKVCPLEVNSLLMADLTVESQTFERQVAYIIKNFNVISLADLAEVLNKKCFFILIQWFLLLIMLTRIIINMFFLF